jgi:hypothetical protein
MDAGTYTPYGKRNVPLQHFSGTDLSLAKRLDFIPFHIEPPAFIYAAPQALSNV